MSATDRQADLLLQDERESTVEERGRPTGQEIFDSLSKAEQDEMLGPEAAEKVRQGEATLADFVMHDGNFITQKPVEQVKAFQEEEHPRAPSGRFTDKPDKPKAGSVLSRRQSRRRWRGSFTRPFGSNSKPISVISGCHPRK
jgi:hypothetical protein